VCICGDYFLRLTPFLDAQQGINRRSVTLIVHELLEKLDDTLKDLTS